MKKIGLENPIYIIEGLRTSIASANKSLKNFSSAQLAGFVIKEMVRRHGANRKALSEILLGNTVSAGTGQNIARQAAILAGVSEKIPSVTINNVCGSGLQSVLLAARTLLAGEAEMILAGGTESASQCPLIIRSGPTRSPQEPISSLFYDGLFCSITQKSMGQLAEDLAQKHRISREEQDEYALLSHQKACRAQKEGFFKKEIVPIRNAGAHVVDSDGHPRENLEMEMLSVLPPAFIKNGSITSGNASSPCDGSAVMLLAQRDFIRKKKIKPKARIIDYASVMIDPRYCFEGAVVAVQECLKKSGLTVKDIDLFEVCESFAAQAIFAKNKLRIPDEKLNVWGGDIALGHPLGSAGTRILVTLMNALETLGKKAGVAVICYGGGGAVAVAIEAV